MIKMFEIRYRINENFITLDEDGFMDDNILGFFEINVNGNCYGYYHIEPFRDSDCLWEYISDWFVDLIRAHQELNNSGYVAISDINSHNSWIEFKKIQDMVQISIIRVKTALDDKMVILDKPLEEYQKGEQPYQSASSNYENISPESVILLHSDCEASPKLTPFEEFEYGEWHHQLVSLSEIRYELIKKASLYLDELRKIDTRLIGRNNTKLEALVSRL